MVTSSAISPTIPAPKPPTDRSGCTTGVGDAWRVFFSKRKDFTSVCTTEPGEVARIKPDFDRRGTRVAGLRVDSVAITVIGRPTSKARTGRHSTIR